MTMQILGRTSSINVRKVLWTCDEIGLTYEREDWGAGFQATSAPEFLALNPNAQIPVIRDGDFIMWESNAIIRYLANRYGNDALYPSDPLRRARVDQWIDWQSSELNRAWGYAFMALVRKSDAYKDADQVASSITNWTRCMRILDQQLLSTGGFVASEAFTLADIPIGLSVQRWMATPFEHPVLPAVQAYYERLSTRAAYQQHGNNGVP